jgi:hypothetical protein
MQIRGTTQIMDESISLSQLTQAVQLLINKQWYREDFITVADQLLLESAAFNPDLTVQVYLNGVLLQPSEYAVGSGAIGLNQLAAEADQITVMYGQRPIGEQIWGDQMRRYTNATFVGSSIEPFAGTVRWYPPYRSTLSGIYAAMGVVSTNDIVLGINKNGVQISTHTLLAGTNRSTNAALLGAMEPSDYLTVDILSGSGGEGLIITIEYSII